MARDLILLTMSGKYTCAQCCIGMVTHCSLQDALDALELKGGSTLKNIINALNQLKTPCSQQPIICGRPPIKAQRAIVELRVKSAPKLAWLAVWSAGSWYCPQYGYSEKAFHHEWPSDMYPVKMVEIKNV